MKFDAIRSGVKVTSPAKLNLFLDVLGRRQDGFHDIITVMETVSLCDTVTLMRCDEGIDLSCDEPSVPCDSSNIAWRAARMMLERCDRSDGLRITIDKRIPVAGGLAGGSSNAAAVLLGLNHLWDARLSRDELISMASQLGSDVPFFVVGGTSLCRGRGEIVEPLAGCGHRAYVIACPGVSVSTADVYKNVGAIESPAGSHLKDKQHNANIIVDLLGKGRAPARGTGGMFNRLEAVTEGLYPELREYRRRLCQAGLGNVMMSGSGSCYFSPCRDISTARKHRRELSAVFDGRVFCAETFE